MATQDEYDVDPITNLPRKRQPSTGLGDPTNTGANTGANQNPAGGNTPPAATSPGADYLKQVRDRMAGKDPVVQNATNHNQHAKAVQEYLAQSRARMTSSQAGFDVGTLQHQRVQDREQANAAQANRASDQQLGDLMRARGAETMTLARDVEQQEQKAINDLIASMTDNPVAANYLRRVHAAGGDVRQAYESMFAGSGGAGGGAGTGAGTGTGPEAGGTGGTGSLQGTTPGGITPGALRDEFRPQTAAEIELESIKSELRVQGVPEAEIDARAQQTYQTRKTDETAAADEARNARLLTRAAQAVANGRFDQLTPEERTAFLQAVPVRAATALPRNAAEVAEILKGDPAAQFVQVNGTPYQIMDAYQQTTERNTGTKSNRHAQWTQVKDLNTGKDAWVNKDGLIVDSKPPGPRERGKHVDYDATRGVWVETYEHSGGRTGRYYDPATRKWRRS